MKKFLFILTAAVIGFAACTKETVPVEGISFKSAIQEITVGGTLAMEYDVFPENANIETSSIEWSSSDETIAKIDTKGILKGVSRGEAIISMKYSGMYASCKVIVHQDIYMSMKQSLVLGCGESYMMELACVPDMPLNNVVWSSDNEQVVTIDKNGLVTAIAEGDANITATLYSKEVQCIVKVLPMPEIWDYYYDDNTWSSVLDESKTVIGIVLAVDVDGCKGKILSLDEHIAPWGPMEDTDALNQIDGRENHKVIEEIPDWQKDYTGFAWAKAKKEGGLEWYIPANREWRQIIAGTRGLKWVTNNGDPANNGTISDWDKDYCLPGFIYFEESYNTFKAMFETLSGTKIVNTYWSSVNIKNYAYSVADMISTSSGSTYFNQKSTQRPFKAIARF